MSFFFSRMSLTDDALNQDSDDNDGGVVIVEANSDLWGKNIPPLQDTATRFAEESTSSLIVPPGNVQPSSSAPTTRATDYRWSPADQQDLHTTANSLLSGEIDLSQTDFDSIEHLVMTYAEETPSNIDASLKNMASTLCTLGQGSPSRHDHPAVEGTTSAEAVPSVQPHPFESFEAIGQMQMEQSLLAPKEQQDIPPVDKEWLWSLCRSTFNFISTVFQLGTSFFAGAWSLTTKAWTAIYIIYQTLSAIVTRVCDLAAFVYKTAKVSLRTRVTDASSEVVAFLAGVTTTLFFVTAIWLVKYSTLSAFNFAYLNTTSAVGPIWQKGMLIRSILVGEETVVNAMPNLLPVSTSELDEQVLSHVVDVVEHTEPTVVALLSNKRAKDEQISVRVVAPLSNHLDKDDMISYHPLAESTNCILPAPSNQSSSFRLLPVHNGPSDSWTLRPSNITVPLNICVLIALAAAYILLPRKCAPKKSQERFLHLSGKQLQAECKKRGLSPPAIRQDMIRHLCKHDGINHSFAQRNLANYTDLNKIELQRALKNLGANTSGNKQDLQYRLLLAREAVYKESPKKDLQRILQQYEMDANDMDFARRLAEAGPQLPLQGGK